MSGYLQRLASSVRSPTGAIHPVVGPLYSTSRFGSAPETFLAEEEIVVASRPESGMTPGPQPLPEVRQAEPSRSEPPETTPLIPRVQTLTQIVQDAVRNEGLKPMPEERPLFKPLAPEVFLTAAPPRREHETGPMQAAVKENLRPEEQEAIPRNPFRPLIQETLHQTDIRTTIRNSRPLPPDAGRDAGKDAEKKERPDPSRRAAQPDRRPDQIPARRMAQPDRQPDEIQIHIGRIEVTAVPPPVARPATPTARKSLNLDEYLKRGRGRAS